MKRENPIQSRGRGWLKVYEFLQRHRLSKALFTRVNFCGGVNICYHTKMNIKAFAIMFLLFSLLTQQVSAGVMNVSMFGNMSSSTSSETSSGETMDMSHQHHQMSSQMGSGMNQADA
ncbi:MAG: hypothetical protein RLP12_06585, partial [Ekhidna sp.]